MKLPGNVITSFLFSSVRLSQHLARYIPSTASAFLKGVLEI